MMYHQVITDDHQAITDDHQAITDDHQAITDDHHTLLLYVTRPAKIDHVNAKKSPIFSVFAVS